MTIVLSIPTLIASIYGMNVPLPYQDEPEAFMLLIAIMVVLSGVVAGIFFKKRFFWNLEPPVNLTFNSVFFDLISISLWYLYIKGYIHFFISIIH